MATRFLDKEHGTDTLTAITDSASNRRKVRNLQDAAGIVYDRVANLLKYNGNDAIKVVVSEDGTQTLTNKTLTSPTITSPTISGATISGSIDSDYKQLVASETFDADVTPGLITGFAWTVVPGTYYFDFDFATTMTTNAGLTLAFKLTTATLTSIRYNTTAHTASDNTTAVSTTGTTTTDLTEPFNSKTAAYTRVRMYGSMVVAVGGTFSLYGCQETSGTGGDVTVLLLGSTGLVKRIA